MSLFDTVVVGAARLWPFGLSPKAPGTVGSLASVLVAPWLFLPLSLPLRLAVLAIIFCLGALAATKAELALGTKDPSSVVIDELVGQWIALLFITPASAAFLPGPVIGPASAKTPVIALLLAFFFFRLFDIWKPGPVRASESWLPHGWGIMIDDVVAGAMALVCMVAVMGILARL